MNKQISQLITIASISGMVAMLAGCKCVSPKSDKSGLATITEQPKDVQVSSREDAVFKVRASGTGLTYQWYFQTGEALHAVPDGQGPTLVLPATERDRTGFYWCAIDSIGPRGILQTRTRDAALVQQTQSLTSTNPPPAGGQIRPSTGGTNACCSPVCGLVNFNNGGLGYSLVAGQTFNIKLTRDSAGQNVVDTSVYCAQWRWGGQANQAGCFTDVSSTLKQFIAPVTKPYAITIYIKSACPPSGTLYYLWPQ